MTTAFAVWLTGLPASGKSTIRKLLVDHLRHRGVDAAVLESDELRGVLGGSYDEPGRDSFYRSVAWIGGLLTHHGVPVIFDATANRRRYREYGRERVPLFIEVYVSTPLAVCIDRDPKGIYRRGQDDPTQGDVPGLQASYEPPEAPDVVIDGAVSDPDQAAASIIDKLEELGWIESI